MYTLVHLPFFTRSAAAMLGALIETQTLGSLAVFGAIVLAGAAVVVTARLLARVAAVLQSSATADRAAEPLPILHLCAQDDPTAEGHPRPRAPGYATAVAAH